MAIVKNNTAQHFTKSCPRKDGFFDDISLQPVPTEDGSNTLMGPWGETKHTKTGAIQESQHVYIISGLLYYLNSQVSEGRLPHAIHILEVGFGTGLNALLTYRAMNSCIFPKATPVYYETVEMFPLPENITNELLYPDSPREKEFFRNIHRGKWGEPFQAAEGLTMLKQKGNILDYQPQEGIHVVYYDAFSPGVQPELWSRNVFAGITPSLEKAAVLTTYCCRGMVKNALRELGFLIERLPGTGRKRHILRAVYCMQSC